MRSLGQPAVLGKAALAALLSAGFCLPRLLGTPQHYALWYLEAVLLFGGFVLWSFVFAWHTAYTHRPVFTLTIDPNLMLWATGTTSAIAAVFSLWIDPTFRLCSPHDYPTTLQQWLTATLFSLAFTQLFLVFSPLAWLARISGKAEHAVPLAIVFVLAVRALQDHGLKAPLPWGFSLTLWSARCATALLSLYFYLRGGVLLAWWCGLVLQSRHLLNVDF